MGLPSFKITHQDRDDQPTVVLFDGVGLQLLLAYGRPLQRPANGKLRRNPVLPCFAGKPFSTVATTSASVAPRSSKRRAACGVNCNILDSRANPRAWGRGARPGVRG